MRAWLGVAAVLVRVYDVSGQPDEDRRAALEVAQNALATAGVQVIFRNCAGGSRAKECDSVPDDGERIVRFINSPTKKKAEMEKLGSAVVDAATNTGVLATIYFDRVAKRAAETIDRRLLLGRTVAHELGHLILGDGAHSPSGLMRAFWTDEELRENQASDWTFSAEDRWRLRRCLSAVKARTCAH